MQTRLRQLSARRSPYESARNIVASAARANCTGSGYRCRQGKGRDGVRRVPRSDRGKRQRLHPNLAAQRTGYLEAQLKALKDGYA